MEEYYYSYEFEKLAEMEGVIIEHIEENFTSEEELSFHKPKTSVIAFGTFLSAVGTFLNIIVLLALLRSGTAIKGTNKVLLGLLSSTHLFSLVLIVPFEVAREYQRKWPLGDVMCKFWTLANHLAVPLMLWTCCAMCVDRICHIRQLNRYVSCDRKYKLPGLLIGVLLLCCVSVAPLIGWMITHDLILPEVCAVAVDILYTPILTTLCYYLPAITCIITLIIFTFITKNKINHLRFIDRQESLTVLDPQSRIGPCGKTTPPNARGHATSIDNTRQCITAISLVCILFWAPFYVVNLTITYCEMLCIDPRLWTLLLWLGYSSYLLCPPLYLIDNRLRLTVKSWIGKEPSGEMEFLNSRSSTTSDYSIKPDTP